MNKSKIIKIVVPLVIIIAIAGIWFVKSQSTSNAPIVNKGVQPLKEEDFELNATQLDMEELKEYNLPIVLTFGSDSCLPCISFYPVLKSAHSDLYGRVIIKYIDVYKSPEITSQFPIQVTPTIILIGADGNPYVAGKGINLDFARYNLKTTGELAFVAYQGAMSKKQFDEVIADMGVVR